MSQIILPKPQPGNPLAPLDIFGHIHSGGLSLKISLIESVQLFSDGKLTVTMASGGHHDFAAEPAKIFLADLNAAIAAILQQLQSPQIVGVPPGAQLRTH